MGNLIADDGRGRQFTYNAMGRMAEVRQGASVLRRYAYNAWGEQVSKTDGTEAGTTLTLYDEAGHWLGDYDHAGHATQQAVWLDDHPIGLMQAGHTYYLETDHLGTPRVAIDPARDVAVWRWDLKGEAFGSTAPDEDPDQDGVALVLDMRFPGQRYDRMTGLHQNYQRDYDHLVGRYIESDPLGLTAGISTYGYADLSPQMFIDPIGLQVFTGNVPRMLPEIERDLTDCEKNVLANGAVQLIPFVGLYLATSQTKFTPFGGGPLLTDDSPSERDFLTGALVASDAAIQSNFANDKASSFIGSRYHDLSTGSKAHRRVVRRANNTIWSGAKSTMRTISKVLGPIGYGIIYVDTGTKLRGCTCDK
jgi:RHS repeat-associated protein